MVGKKTLVAEKVFVSSKSAIPESISLPKSKAARRPKFMPKNGPGSHPYVNASPATPQGDRQSPEGCSN